METQTREIPSLEQVGELEKRLNDLTARREHVRVRLAELADGLAQLHAEGRQSGPEADALRGERRGLQDEESELASALPVVEANLAQVREVATTEAARKRLRGLSRAHGSLRAQVADDDRRVIEAANALGEAVQRRTDRLRKLGILSVEAQVLSWRFDLDEPSLPSPEPTSGTQPLAAVRMAAAGLDLTASRVPSLTTSSIASAGVVERRLSRLNALKRYMEQHGTGSFTPETKTILETAGDPNLSALEAQAKSDREGRERDAARKGFALRERFDIASGATQG